MDLPDNPIVKQSLKVMMDHMNDVVIITDSEQKIIWVSSGFLKLTKYQPTEVIGKNPKMLQGSETSPEAIRKMGEGVRENKFVKVDVINYTKTGEKYWLRLSIYPVTDDNGIRIGYIGIEFDITDKYDQNEMLERLSNSLKKELSDKNRIMSILSRDMLDMVVTYEKITEKLLRQNKEVSINIKESLLSLNRNTVSMRALIKNITELYRGQSKMHEVFPINEVVNNSIEYIKPIMKLKKLFVHNNTQKHQINGEFLHVLFVVKYVLKKVIDIADEYGTIVITSETDLQKTDLIVRSTSKKVFDDRLDTVYENEPTHDDSFFIKDLMAKNGVSLVVENDGKMNRVRLSFKKDFD